MNNVLSLEGYGLRRIDCGAWFNHADLKLYGDKALEGGKVKDRVCKGIHIGEAQIKGETVMAFEYDLIKSWGIKVSERRFIDSGMNPFTSFVLEGEFGTLKRFYIANIYEMHSFLNRDDGTWHTFRAWFMRSPSSRNSQCLSGLKSYQSAMHCAVFYDYAKQRCEMGGV